MKSIDGNILNKCAKDLMFELSKEELEMCLANFSVYEKLFPLIEQIDNLQDYEEMHFPYEVEISDIREDDIEKSLTTEDVLSNVPNKKEDFVVIPRVVRK